MNTHITAGTPTQVAHPWRAVLRTILAWIVGAAAMAPFIYEAITQADVGSATGAAAGALAIAGAITRVAALPQVNSFIERFLPWLATGVHTEEGGADT